MIDPQVQQQQTEMMNYLRKEKNVSGKIIVLDDDKELSSARSVVNGRISKRITPIFHKLGLKDEFLHFVTFENLVEALDKGYLSKNGNLFVMDSHLSEGKQEYSFNQTVPTLLELGIKPKYLMPGSGGPESSHNNQVFVNIIENKGYNMKWGQENLSAFGLTGNTNKFSTRYLEVVAGILSYAEELNVGNFAEPLKEVKSEIAKVENTEGVVQTPEGAVSLR